MPALSVTKQSVYVFWLHYARFYHIQREFYTLGHTVEEYHMIASLAFEHGFNPGLRSSSPGEMTFLHVAVEQYHNLLLETISLFKKYNVDFNAVRGNGQSVFEVAIQWGASSTVLENLIQAGCILPTNESRQNVLHMACKYCNLSAVKYFVEQFEFKVNKACKRGYTPLHYAVASSADVIHFKSEAYLFK
ncbi:unnamed protein product [Orchesella dallaii]|uniref:Uncharacterized protein n=1 Tax=Orchesella dallaii TaxID=48710 RepID=A0ABP1RAN4_9HEXA